MSLPEVLPAALYDLSRYGPSKIMNGTAAPPSTFDRLLAQLAQSTVAGASQRESSKPVRLSRELLCQILRGREESQRFLACFVEKELYARPPSKSCQNLPRASPPSDPPTAPEEGEGAQNTPPPIQQHNNPCQDSFHFIHLDILRSVGGISFGRDSDPLFTLTQAVEMLDRTDLSGSASSSTPDSPDGPARQTFGLNVCPPCRQDFVETVRKAREEIWTCLPRWFGLLGPDKGVDVAAV
jgi:hypothetical protein